MQKNPSPFSFINCAVTVRELPQSDRHKIMQSPPKIARPTAKQVAQSTAKLNLDPKWLLVTGMGD